MSKTGNLSIHILSVVENLPSILINRLRNDFGAKFSISYHQDLAIEGLSEQKIREKLTDCDILVGDTTFISGETLQTLPNLQWMQSTFAGVNKTIKSLDSSKPNPSCVLTRYSGNFGTHMAEYVLTYILAKERQVMKFDQAQKSKHWYNKKQIPIPRLLNQLTIAVLGVGNIGREICKQCSFHGMTALGMVNTPRSKKDSYISEYFTFDQLPQVLERCDYICSILPSTPKTQGLLDGDILSSSKKSPVFINVGRGDVISEATIINALDKKWISQAVLDVFLEEPLPESSLLWSRDDVVITPHCSALTDPNVFVEEFIQNVNLFIEQKPLLNVVNFEKGY